MTRNRIKVVDQHGESGFLSAVPMPNGSTVTENPIVALVVESRDGSRPGHPVGTLYITPENSNILGEYLRQAAEAATPNQGEN